MLPILNGIPYDRQSQDSQHPYVDTRIGDDVMRLEGRLTNGPTLDSQGEFGIALAEPAVDHPVLPQEARETFTERAAGGSGRDSRYAMTEGIAGKNIVLTVDGLQFGASADERHSLITKTVQIRGSGSLAIESPCEFSAAFSRTGIIVRKTDPRI